MAFRSVVDNWIKWTPGPGGIYTPENVAQVKTKGIESSLSYENKFENWNLSFEINYTWCQSTTARTDEIYGEQLIGKQLMYAPEHITGMMLSANYRSYGVTTHNAYTGVRYTTGDNASKLNSYMTTDMIVEKQIVFKKQSMQCYVKASNLFNSIYQVMAYRPTPGRWYSIGIKFNFNLNNTI
jgi:iron complex outermembrane receptor protein